SQAAAGDEEQGGGEECGRAPHGSQTAATKRSFPSMRPTYVAGPEVRALRWPGFGSFHAVLNAATPRAGLKRDWAGGFPLNRAVCMGWGWQDSNLRTTDYESAALTG